MTDPTPQPPNPETQPHSPPPDLGDWLTRTRHIFYGTASSLVEMLQDPQKRTENLNKLSLDLGELADELAAKGALTEAEALEYLQQLRTLQQDPNQPDQAPITIEIQDAETMPVDPTIPPDPSNRVSQEDIQALMDLTRQVESLRLDLERSRTDPKPSPD